MYLREADQDAYKDILYFETLFRRLIRWEVRGAHGRRWLLALDVLQGKIEERIQAEKRLGAYNPDSSELSYLSLAELIEIVFGYLWRDCFQQVLNNKKHIRNDPCRALNAVRNKVAHFRPIDQNDGKALAGIEALFDVLALYYRDNLKASAYIPGDFEASDGQLDQQEISRLISYLEAHDAKSVWDEFQQLESVRSAGLSPGIGVVSHHVFFELYTRGRFRAPRLVDCLVKYKYEITFMNVGNSANYVRIFVPIRMGAQDIRRVMRKITAAALSSVDEQPFDTLDIVREFDLGYFESLGADQTNLYFGFVF